MSGKHRSYFGTDFVCETQFWENFIPLNTPSYFLLVNDVCPETKKRHFHFVLHYDNPRSLSSLRKYLAPRHVEPCRTLGATLKYCDAKKEFNPDKPLMEFGTRPAQGLNKKVSDYAQSLYSGEISMDTVVMSDPQVYNQYRHTFEKVLDIKLNDNIRSEKTKLVWLYGTTGVGKSHLAFHGLDDYYLWNLEEMYQTDYNQQDIVVIEDFRGEIKYNELLKLADKWPHKVPRKFMNPLNFTSKLIIITSSMTPLQVYHEHLGDTDSINQLTRRIDYISEVTLDNRLLVETQLHDIKSSL